MARITLREYIQDIESLIEQNRHEEAIGHCKHILKAFPKNIEVYRLLGKAYLESQRLGDAADIFQRLLSAVPDDFVAHVGMSFIREDEGNLDAALWHMERAYEVQPYNPAIQVELRRLYAKREGIEPPKVRLTRGALARMYNKGGLYEQAISELQKGLAEEPNRYDLLVVLADAYAKNNNEKEAINTCSRLLAKLPYCYVANKILSKLLEGTERERDAQTCKKRLIALDPYEAHISSQYPTSSDVPANAIVLHKLEWTSESFITSPESQPAWAESIGVQVDTDTEEEIPEWLKPIEESQPDEEIQQTSQHSEEEFTFRWEAEESTQAATDIQENIPDWMRDAGWRPAQGEEQPGEVPTFLADTNEDDEDVEIAPAEIPDWLKDISPPEDVAPLTQETDFEDATLQLSGEESSTEPIESSDEQLPEWLGELGPTAPDKPMEEPADEELPDWLLESLESESQAAEEKTGISHHPAEETEIRSEDMASMDALPAWLKELSQDIDKLEQGEAPEIPEEELLSDIPIDELASPSTHTGQLPDLLLRDTQIEHKTEEPEAEAPAEPVAEEAEEVPEWLQEISAQELPETEPEAEAPAEPVAEEAEEVPEWLQEISAQELPETEPEAEAPAEPVAEEAEEVPEWLQEISAQEFPKAEPEAEAPAEPVAEEAEEVPEWLQEISAQEFPKAEPEAEAPAEPIAEEAEEVPEWLQEISAQELPETEPEVEAPAEPIAEEAEEVPEWLQEISAQELPETEPEAEAPAEPVAEEAEEVPEWLQEISAQELPETEPEAEAPAEPVAEEAEEVPEWLQEISAQEFPKAEPEAEAPAKPVAEEAEEAEEVPEWLQEISAQELPETEPEAEAPAEPVAEEAEEVPEWLQEISAQELPETEPEAEAPAEPIAEEAEEVPEWLQEISAQELPEAEPEAEIPIEMQADEISVPEQIPGDLDKMSQPQMVEPPPEEEMPEWLKNLILAEQPEEQSPQKGDVEVIAGEPEFGESQEDKLTLPEPPSMELYEEETAEEYTPTSETKDEKLPEWMQESSPSVQQPVSQEEKTPPWMDSSTPGDEDSQLMVEGIETEEESPAPEAEIEASTEELPTSDVDLTDTDAALAWLESLAAKQGVPEEELVTSPEERQEAPPDWVTQLEETAELLEPETEPETIEQEYAESEIPATAEPTYEEPTISPIQDEPEVQRAEATESEAQEPDLSDSDAALAWLESLAAKQGVAEEELITSPEERKESPPEWVQDEIQETVQTPPQEEVPVQEETQPETEAFKLEPESEGIAPEETTTDWVPESLAEPPSTQEQEEAPAEIEIEESIPTQDIPVEEAITPETVESEHIEPAWLQDLEKSQTPTGTDDESTYEIEEAQPEPIEDIEPPSWVVKGVAPEEDTYDWMPPAVLEELKEVSERDTRLDINKASLVELERLPGIGFRVASSIVSYRENNGPIKSIEELKRIPDVDPTSYEILRALVDVTPPPQETQELPPLSQETRVLPRIEIKEPEDKTQRALMHAQELLDTGQIEEAVKEFQKVIKKGYKLPELIDLLEKANENYPNNIQLLQILGDAYMRADRLQEALDIYTKAQQLLQ